jgi:hypothetical protein
MKQMARTDPVRKARASLANYCRRCGVGATALNRGGDITVKGGRTYVTLHPADGGEPIVARVETKVGYRVVLVSGAERTDILAYNGHIGSGGHAGPNGHIHPYAQSELVTAALDAERDGREGLDAFDGLGGASISPGVAKLITAALDRALDTLVNIEARVHAAR